MDERFIDLEVKLAFQDRLIRELDVLVRQLATRLDQTDRELAQLKQTVLSPDKPVGAANEPPPHY
jgi:uncharacterized coiled-coil protein SlyX